MIYLSSGIKMEEYIESELSGIFWVKTVTKNIVLGLKERVQACSNGSVKTKIFYINANSFEKISLQS